MHHRVHDAADWRGSDLANDASWVHTLTSAEIDDLLVMASDIRPQLNNNPDALLNLPLEAFTTGRISERIEQIFRDLKDGKGVALVKGLPVSELDPLDVATIYWGIGCQIGDATPNNPQGDLFGHVTDLGKTAVDANSRGYQSREMLDYHCDQSDVVALLCIRDARTGGKSRVASSIAVFNELQERCPEFAAALAQPLHWTKHGEHDVDDAPFYTSAVFNFLDGKLCTSFGPKHIFKGHDLPGTPALSEIQRDAIRATEEIAHAIACEMVLEPGDMQFLNNYVTLHTRTAYSDYDETNRKRLLWRLWLMNEALRPRTDYSRQWQQGVALGQRPARIRL